MRDDTLAALNDTVRRLQTVASLVREDTNDAVATGDHVTILRHFHSLRNVNSLIKEAREALSQIEDNLSTRDIPDAMKAHGVKTVTIEGVGRCTVSYRFSCSMLDKELGIKWLKDNGHGGIVQETVNSSTMGAFAKNLLETEGKELPDDIFKTGTAPYTSITKVK